jgi:uncharacterized protein YggE
MAFRLPASPTNKIALALDLRIVCLVLLVIVVTMLCIWKPWAGSAVSDRTVEVNGEATVTAKPDKFVFYPSYEFKNTDKAAALAQISQKSEELTTKLKGLGVKDSDIKTSSSGYDYPVYKEPGASEPTYNLQITVTTASLDMAQKVQDYLVTTSPLGSVSPQPSFSEQKRRQLESQARDLATRDARAKVDQMAKNVGFKVGAVKKISETQGFSILPMEARDGAALMRADAPDSASSQPSLGVQPGENELPYSVSVTYYIR